MKEINLEDDNVRSIF